MENRISLPCSNGFTLHTDGENIIIATKKSEEIVPISRIQSFSLKEPGLAYGKIVFTTAQAATAGVGIGFGMSAALGAEKTFFYSKADLATAKQFRDVVVNYEKHTSQAGSAMVVSIVDEIRGLKALLDEGILTQEEFDAKKAQLLNL